ncbi:flagellar basal body P-ring formation chaperone FlgA [Variovorax sp. OV084]|jgi:flagella basal body P-ring formation protein FlgA|uniref:flagellar basal body P-ring formation chaperone FlgA n=1 Tax=Variovorax sp. OV084 TaxID=1882777 RepID=UPI0008AF9F0E|nr:flagellar basal body P-ring formation chaperone FlgA [Variovorax sp. OV084]SET66083.1 flagella basal body P-ring formation protein FlgA [Variovorax sp. OV084]
MTLFKLRNRSLPALVAMVCTASAFAAAADANAADVNTVIEKYLQVQTAGLPGKVTINIDARSTSNLPACDAPEAFLPPGATPWGRVSVGVRCQAERPWTRYVQAHVAVEGSYFVAARAIDSGRPLGAGDVTERTGDLTRLPRSVITSAAELAGVVTVNRVAPGAPLRKELVRGVTVIQQGQAVKVVAQGQGFVVSTEGKAMTGAVVGAVVQAKTRDGRLVSGVADEEGQIQLAQ